jgi:hypothetical protein
MDAVAKSPVKCTQGVLCRARWYFEQYEELHIVHKRNIGPNVRM